MGSNMTARFTATATFSDGYPTTADRDILAFADDWERIDVRFAFAPRNADWEVAIYGRNITDNRKYHGSSAGDFMSRSTDIIFDGGTTTAFERERRYGGAVQLFLWELIRAAITPLNAAVRLRPGCSFFHLISC